jgi:hypothetical protein
MENGNNDLSMLVFIQKIIIDNEEIQVYNIVTNIDFENVNYFFTYQATLDMIKNINHNSNNPIKLLTKQQLESLISTYEKEHHKQLFKNYIVDIWCLDDNDNNKPLLFNTWDNTISNDIDLDKNKGMILVYTISKE